jgi:hypothetical protein
MTLQILDLYLNIVSIIKTKEIEIVSIGVILDMVSSHYSIHFEPKISVTLYFLVNKEGEPEIEQVSCINDPA